MSDRSVYQIITEHVFALLEQGTVPWQKLEGDRMPRNLPSNHGSRCDCPALDCRCQHVANMIVGVHKYPRFCWCQNSSISGGWAVSANVFTNLMFNEHPQATPSSDNDKISM